MGGGDDVDFAQVEANGASGGVLTMWDKKTFHYEYVVEDFNFLVVVGKWVGVPGLEGLVNVYGPRDVRERKETWRRLEFLVLKEEVKWCIFGDFNEVRKLEERANSITNVRGAAEFNDFIRRSSLLEVPMNGRKFTRVNDDGLKFSKLDRFLITNEFGLAWNNLGVKTLERKWSDHLPIMLYEDRADFGAKSFKFFNWWIKEEGVEDLVKEVWGKEVKSIRPDCIFRDKLKNVKGAFTVWAKQRFGKMEEALTQAKEETLKMEEEADLKGWKDVDRNRWINARSKWLDLEEKKLETEKQKAKIKWATDGDENSKLFHVAIKYRERKNALKGLKTQEGWTEDPGKIKEFAFDFFKNKFSSHFAGGPRLQGNKYVKISGEDAFLLERQFDEEEIWCAVKGCGNNKAPGPDGFTIGFVKKSWETIKVDLIKAVTWFWKKAKLVGGVMHLS